MKPLIYEEIVTAFKNGLIDTLRGHGAAEEYLAMWVPDDDPVTSLLNMADGTQAANRKSLAVQISGDTLDEAALAKLKALAESVSDFKTEQAGTDLILKFENLHALSGGVAAADTAAATPDAGGRTEPGAQDESPRVNWSEVELNPFYEEAVSRFGADIQREGTVSSRDGLVTAEAIRDWGRMAVLIDRESHVIVEARHSKVASLERRAILDAICRIVEGKPIQEASDHAGTRVVFQMAGRSTERAVPGIQLPTNSGRAFNEAVELVRDIREIYGKQVSLGSTENFFDLEPGAVWKGLAEKDKLELLEKQIGSFADSAGLEPGSIIVDRIEKDLTGQDLRIVVGFSGEVAPGDKPPLLRRLERILKDEIDHSLQVHMEILKDSSKIRRL